jgi:ornithine cyclodeaminase/alanine dehydrogenase-like protein (mu-crystallin family)
MTLIINNADVAKVLTMETTMAALEEAYLALAAREAVCRPRKPARRAILCDRRQGLRTGEARRARS